jgi:hypothetical protein
VSRLTLALTLLASIPAAASAQIVWKSIGTTVSGNPVYVAPKTIKKSGNLVNATVRVVFMKPVQTPRGTWATSRTTATVDCATRKLAAKENVYYADVKERKVVDRTVNKLPGFGPVLQGSLGELTVNYLCSLKRS